MINEKDKKKGFNIDEFLIEIGREPLLSAEEEMVLIKAIQEKGPECNKMDKLVRSNMRFVVSVANQYKNKGLSLEELIEVGTEGLKKAVEKFDLNAECKFLSYAVWWIRQAMIQAISEKTGNPMMDARIESLVKMLERNHHRWNETFIDEDTGEEVTVERDELISTDTTEEERNLMENVAASADKISTEALRVFIDKTRSFWPRPFDDVYMELVRRGDESWACVIDNPEMLQKLCDKGIKEAAEQLYQKYRYGDEKNGIFIDKKAAKTYYDMAGDAVYEQYTTEDFPEEEYPKEFHYTLIGNSVTLDGVETLINDLCQQFGTPGNECGLFVPQQMLMKMLVGSDSEYYRGNVLAMERKASDSLVITTEADNGEPLLYALRQCFKNLDVEMK
ncbi:MAG: sigma-70 family RNA polymerase sigma factor [Prevotella sp.]|nr:sigma-70 family RNA polymerase sigma factor [Prevotella sp.]MBO7539941.1 sigma-70 family RNA polymerase sigma factor [Prevotella sp.]